jgi:2-amino-4-hydroxy-6-hydroxymethyldihydropteridine diphosphokinase
LPDLWGWRLNVPGKEEKERPGLGSGRGIGRPSERAYHRAYIGLGSNIDPASNIAKALELLGKHVILGELAHTWETPAIGSRGPNFLNTVVAVRTQLPPDLLKSLILRRIERQLGRVRTANKNAPRTIDLDILVYEGQVLDPKIWSYVFVAVPLAELLPHLRNSQTGETLEQAAKRLSEQTPLKSRSDLAIETYKSSDETEGNGL